MIDQMVPLDQIFTVTWSLSELWGEHVKATHRAGRTPEAREAAKAAKLRYDGALIVLANALAAAGVDITPGDPGQSALARAEELLEEWAAARGLA